LQSPIASDPQDGIVAKQLLNNKEEFEQTASFWRLFYATNSTSNERMKKHPIYESKLIEIKMNPLVIEKKICDSELVQLLSCNDWHVERAIHCLI
jgi:hypothetical protein